MQFELGITAVFLAITGCGLPVLDPSRTIEAGARGECPPGQVARWGVCCPEESSLTQCPSEGLLPGRQTGSLRCGAEDNCEQGYACRWGQCCPPMSSLTVCPAEALVPGRQTGAVACEEGNCAQGYACRWGRCCPPESTALQCPAPSTITPTTDGSLRCDGAGQCPSTYSCRLGIYCCPATGGTGPCAPLAIAQPCSVGAACQLSGRATGAPAPECIGPTLRLGTSLPGGYCSAKCDTRDIRSCGNLGQCLSLGGALFTDPLIGICVARCRLPDSWSPSQPFVSCRSAAMGASPYICVPAVPGETEVREGFCMPDCTVTDYCPRPLTDLFTSRCNAVTHLCRP